jgi:hypothetical protein
MSGDSPLQFCPLFGRNLDGLVWRDAVPQRFDNA